MSIALCLVHQRLELWIVSLHDWKLAVKLGSVKCSRSLSRIA